MSIPVVRGGSLMNKKAFIELVGQEAQVDMSRTGILASLVTAQAILESGYGIASIDNNLFGIKASSTWKGGKKRVTTREFKNGKWITIQTYFRTYPSFLDSIHDHSILLMRPRYKKLINEPDYKKACHIIKECRYATDPNYPKLLIKLIEQYDLTRFDRTLLDKKTVLEIKRKAESGEKLLDPTPEKLRLYKKFQSK